MIASKLPKTTRFVSTIQKSNKEVLLYPTKGQFKHQFNKNYYLPNMFETQVLKTLANTERVVYHLKGNTKIKSW